MLGLDITVGPLGGVTLVAFVVLSIAGLLVAPTLGGAIVFAGVVALLALSGLMILQRIWLRLVGRRGAR